MADLPSPQPAPAEALGMLEKRLVGLTDLVLRLEQRIAALEGTAPAVCLPPAVASRPTPGPPAEIIPQPVRLIGLVGRTCLILGGATFIRALVDAGTLRGGWGVTLGLAYALTWTLLSLRARNPVDAAFHALASILITYPLIVESTARFDILAPGLAALLLFVVTCLHATVAWRRDLQPILWIAALASVGACFAVMAARQSIEPFLTVFLLLGAGSLWLTYGRRWHGLRWPMALSADLAVVILATLVAWPGGPPEAYRGLPPARAMGFGVALVGVYLGSFALRMLQRRRVVNTFEAVQTTLVLLAGFGGALRIGLITHTGVGLLGAGALVAGLGCYGLSTWFARDEADLRPNFRFFTFLGLVFLLLGSWVVLPLPVFGPLAGALGVGTMLLGLTRRRTALIFQSGLYLLASTVATGLALWTFRAFLAPAGLPAALALPGLLSLALLGIALVAFLVKQPPVELTATVRPYVLLLGAAVLGGVGALFIQTCCGVPGAGKLDIGVLAAVRTAVLSALAILLAWFSRKVPALALRWLVYPLLIVTALKFLFEDLAVGRPLTLFLGFMCYGATLMIAPRLLKAAAAPEGDPDPNVAHPEVNS